MLAVSYLMSSRWLACVGLVLGVLTLTVSTAYAGIGCPSCVSRAELISVSVESSLSPELEALLDQIEGAAQGVDGLKARLRFDTISELTGDQKRRFGQLAYAAAATDRPTRFRVHFDVLFVDGGSDGRDLDTAYVYDGQLLAEIDRQGKVYQRTRLNAPGQDQDPFDLGRGPIPLPFKLKKTDLLSRFDVSLSDLEAAPENSFGLKLVPKEDVSIDADVVYLWFDTTTHRPVQARTDDLSAAEIKIVRLIEPLWNPDLSQAVFDTTPPVEAKPPVWSVSDEASVEGS